MLLFHYYCVFNTNHWLHFILTNLSNCRYWVSRCYWEWWNKNCFSVLFILPLAIRVFSNDKDLSHSSLIKYFTNHATSGSVKISKKIHSTNAGNLQQQIWLVSRFTFKIKLVSHMIKKVNNYKIEWNFILSLCCN